MPPLYIDVLMLITDFDFAVYFALFSLLRCPRRSFSFFRRR